MDRFGNSGFGGGMRSFSGQSPAVGGRPLNGQSPAAGGRALSGQAPAAGGRALSGQAPAAGGRALSGQSPAAGGRAFFAEGGAIPDDDSDDAALASNAGVADDTTTDLNGALQTVQQALIFGRQKYGLPGGGGSGANSEPVPQGEQSGIPGDDEESYAGGGSISDDIYASNNATDDGPQYGLPEVVDDPEAVRPPISAPSNINYADVPEQTAIPQTGQVPISSNNLDMGGYAGNESAGLYTNNDVAGDESAGLNTQKGPDESGALPATPPAGDESGAGPVAAPGAAARSGGIPSEYLPHNMLRNLVLSYLQGKEAMPNDQALEIEKSVAKAAKNDPAAIPVLATAAAGSPDQQFAYIQRNRQIYDFAMGHARAALNGVDGKAPSIDAALQSANKAFAQVPDGENVHFVKHGDGLVAQVSGAGGTQTRTYPLTPQQFDQLLDTGKAGMFDKMLAPGGARKALSSFGASQQDQIQSGLKNFQNVGSQNVGPLGVGDAAGRPRAMASRNDSDRAVTMGHDVTLLQASPQYKQQNPNWGKEGGPNARVRVINGDDDRDFINGRDQTPTEQDKKLELIRAKNEGRPVRDYMGEIDAKDKAKRAQIELEQGHKDNRATQGIGSREKIAAEKLMEQAKSREAANGRNAASNAERLIASKQLAGQKLTPQEQAISDRVLQAGDPQRQAPQQQRAPQQQAPQQQRSQQDQQALLWANANPNDPRAARIKQLHGVQ